MKDAPVNSDSYEHVYELGYKAAEEDITAWLLGQVPRAVAQDLALAVEAGAHHRLRAERRQWEIPVIFRAMDPINFLEVKVTMALLGVQLCSNDAGQFVGVPPRPLLPQQVKRLRETLSTVLLLHQATVGIPVAFPMPNKDGVIEAREQK